MKSVVLIVAIIAALLIARSLKSGKSQQAHLQSATPIVVTQPIERVDLAAQREYVGHVDPIQTVSLRPQISGEIAQVHFKDGAMVKAGQLLFSIDSRQFQAAVNARQADLAQAEANSDRADKYLKRLQNSDKRSVSAAAMEAAESDALQGRAAVAQAKAALTTAKINLGYTRITAPISGHASKAIFSKGNYVTPAAELATIIQTDPIRITFTLPDKDYINQIDQFKNAGSDVFNAAILLSNGLEYPEKGMRDFENNQIDIATGTMAMSLRYKNSEGLLVPGSMVRVAVKPAKPQIATVIPQQAVLVDSKGDYVYIVDENNKTVLRRVKLGISYGVFYEVLSGVKAGEQIVTTGIQSIRDGIEVKPIPPKSENETPAPSDLAKESGYDVKAVKDEAASQDTQESAEGKN